MQPVRKSTEIPNQDLKASATKQCSQCKEVKSIDDFYKSGYKPKRAKHQSPSADCKACVKLRVKTRYYGPMYAEIRDAGHLAAKERRDTVKTLVFMKYSGGDTFKCACCGETELTFLTLDHINNDGAAFRRHRFGKQTAAGYTTYSWLFKNGCPDDLGIQVLCANCQHGKRMNYGVCPHHQVRCNDQEKSVGPSGPKRSAPYRGDDMVSSAKKLAAVSRLFSTIREMVHECEQITAKWRKLEADFELATQVEDK